MHFRFPFHFTLIFAIVSAFTCASPYPPSPTNTPATLRPSQSGSVVVPVLPQPAPSLVSRQHLPIPHWSTLFTSYGALFAIPPLGSACRLYSQVLVNALNTWASQPELDQVAVGAGAVGLEFGCSKEPIPWDFVAEFAASEKDAVERGFARTWAWQGWERTGDHGRICDVGFRLAGGESVMPPKGVVVGRKIESREPRLVRGEHLKPIPLI